MRFERKGARHTGGGASTSIDSREDFQSVHSSDDTKTLPLASPKLILEQAHAWTRTFVETANQDCAQEKEHGEGREHGSGDDCQRNQVDDDEHRDGPSATDTSSNTTCNELTENEQDQERQQRLENDLQQIVALLLIDAILINLGQCDDAKTIDGVSCDKNNTDSLTKGDKFAKLSKRLHASADIAIANLADFIVLKSWATKLKQMEDEDRSCQESVQYKQFGFITNHISAVIEIGEDGNGSSCTGGPSPTSIVDTPKLFPQEQAPKKDEIVHMSRTGSDVTTESFVRTASTSVVGSADFKQDKGSTDMSSPQVVDALPSQDDDVSFYSIASIIQMKKDVAEALRRAEGDGNCSPASSTTDHVDNRTNKDDISPTNKKAGSLIRNVLKKHKRKESRVSFAETIVSEVRERPRIDPNVVNELFYSRSDIERFEDEAYDSEGFSISSSYSYTSITPNPSYQGSDNGSEDELDTTPTPAAPKAKEFIDANIANDIADVFLYKEMPYKDDEGLRGLVAEI